MRHGRSIAMVGFLLGSLHAFPADAALVAFSDRGIFELQGLVVEHYGFDDFGPYSELPGDPWHIHGVTYISDQNYVLVGGLGSKPPPVSNVLTANYWLHLSGSLDTPYQMLGFDLATVFATATPGRITLSLTTNQATYTFPALALPDVTTAQRFFGFVSSADEQIVGFELTSDTWGTAPALDNVTLGTITSVIPEPHSIVLLAAGAICLFVTRSLSDRKDLRAGSR